jgi:hypothetical protein
VPGDEVDNLLGFLFFFHIGIHKNLSEMLLGFDRKSHIARDLKLDGQLLHETLQLSKFTTMINIFTSIVYHIPKKGD